MIEFRFRGRQGGFALDAEGVAPGRGVTALFGPSGCGKTTVLSAIAGLRRFPDGHLRVNGEVWQDGRRGLPTHRRPLGYVFQEASLFPHLSVAGNLRYGLRRAAGEVRVGFDEVVELLGIARLFERPTAHLSGGERQRIAIGRALLSQPRLLLMDEPLSALDRASKEEILPYLDRLHTSLSIPVLYVTHDMAEVERLADTLILMEAGRVRATGPVAAMLADPALPFLHGAAPAAVLEGRVQMHDPDYGLSAVDVPGGRILVAGDLGPPGSRCRLRIPASDVGIDLALSRDTSTLNNLPARIVGVEPLGSTQVTVRLVLGGGAETGTGTETETGAALLARISRLSWDRLRLAPGQGVIARVKAVALVDPHRLPPPV